MKETSSQLKMELINGPPLGKIEKSGYDVFRFPSGARVVGIIDTIGDYYEIVITKDNIQWFKAT
jgi:hypothetical protein